MTKIELKKIMNKYCIVECELEDAFAFVSDLLYVRRKELEKDAPYATRAIDRLENAEREVDDLIDYVNELEEE